MEQVKVLYSIGPANEPYDILTKILALGNSGVILSLHTDDYDNDINVIEKVRTFNSQSHTDTSIFVNIIGNEIKTNRFKDGQAFFFDGDEVIISSASIDEGVAQKFSITYSQLYEDIQVGSFIYINCGTILLKVQRIEKNEIVCIVLKGGICYDYSTVNAAETNVTLELLTHKDEEDLIFCCEQKVDYVAISFVRNKDDVLLVRDFLDSNGGKEIKIISKIENREGVNNIEEILSVSDGIMVARGDLGVEIPFVELPAIQKKILRLCNDAKKISIIATHILSSMTEQAIPTRSEIDSIFHMIQDGVGCIMLSGESSSGKHPVETANILREAINFAEKFKSHNYD